MSALHQRNASAGHPHRISWSSVLHQLSNRCSPGMAIGDNFRALDGWMDEPGCFVVQLCHQGGLTSAHTIALVSRAH